MEKIMDEQENFADKVIKSLKGSRAVDLTDVVEEATDITAQSNDFTAYGAQEGGTPGPGSGGNKDIVILPGAGGVAGTSPSQINFYWNSPTTPDLTGIGQSIRTTIYNYASTATSPLLVIGGWDGTTNYVPSPTYGTGGATGTTAKIFINPFLGYITHDYMVLNNTSPAGAAIATTNAAGWMYYDNAQSKIRVGVGAGTAKTIAFTDDVTAASGLATTATSVQAVTATTAANHFILFSPQQGLVSGIAVSTDATLQYNPSTDALTVANVVGTATTGQNVNVIAATTNTAHPVMFTPAAGTVSGAATSTVSTVSINPSTGTLSATTFSGAFSGNLTGNVTGFAQTARNLDLVFTTAAGNHYITFSPQGTSVAGSAISAVTTVFVTPSTGTITATTFSGAFSGNLTGNVTGFAQTSRNVDVVAASTSASHPIMFTPATASVSGAATSTVSTVSVNPSTGTISATTFSGAFSGTASFAQTARNLDLVFTTASGNHFLTFTPQGTSVAGSATSAVTTVFVVPSTGTVTATTFSGAFSGNLTGNVTGFAQTSRNVDVVAASTSASHPVLFTPATTSVSGAATSSVSTVSVNPSTGTITATTFSGTLSGNAGSATTARNIDVATTNTASTVYPVFSGAASTVTGTGLSSNGSLSYVPSTGTLTATTFSGAFTGNLTGFATTSQNINVVAATTNAAHPITFTPATGTVSGAASSSVSTVTVNPSNGTIAATTFSGAFSGNLTGYASTSNNVNVVSTNQNASHYFLFTPVDVSVAGAAVSSDSNVTINPSTNAMSLGSGSLTANNVRIGTSANTVDTSSGNLTLDSNGGTVNINDNLVVSGNFTVNGTTTTVDSTVSTLLDPVIVIGSGLGGTTPSSDDNKDRGIEFRWFSGTAQTGFFGFDDSTEKFTFIPRAVNLGEVFSGTAGTAVFTEVEATLRGNAAGTAATFTNLYGTLAGNVTGNLTGTATTGQNVNVVTTAQNAFHSLLFSPATTSVAGAAVSSGVGLTYNPSTQTLYATNIVGTVTGTISGIAQTANNLTLVSTTASGNHFLTFSSASGNVAGAAISTNTSVFVVPSTGTVNATAFSGSFTGNLTGNASGYAQTSRNVDLVFTTASGNHFITFSPQGTSVSGSATSAVTTVFVTPSTGTVTATTFSGAFTGNVTGFATTGQNVNVIAATTNTAHPIMFTPTAGSLSGAATSTVSTVTVNPSNGTVAATTFSGAFTGNVTGNVTGFAQTSRNVDVVAASTSASHPLLFTPATTSVSGAATSTVSTVSVNPSTGTVSATTFSGAFSGTASFAQTARNLDLVFTTASGNHFLTFTPQGTSVAGSATSAVTTVFVVPSTGTVTATTFSGAFTGNLTGFATTGQNVNIIAATTNTAHPIMFTPTAGSLSGAATSTVSTVTVNPSNGTVAATTFSGAFTGNVTGNVTGFAQTSRNVDVVAATTSASHPIMFTPATTSVSGAATSTVSTVSVNPSTGTVSATTFSGAFTGNVSGYAQTARNIDSVVAASAGNHFLLLSPQSGVSGAAVSTDSNLYYVPTTDTLNVSTLSGVGVTVTASSALTNGTYFTIKTLAGDDNNNVDFFIRGTSSDNTSRFSVDTAGNLRATTKSFDIEHPTKPGKRLVYGVLEGPEHGVYHRGTVEGKGKLEVELPEYWSKLVNEDYSIQLTSWGNYNVHIVEKTDNSFTIELTGNPLSQKFKVIKVDYVVHGSRKDAPLEIEQ